MEPRLLFSGDFGDIQPIPTGEVGVHNAGIHVDRSPQILQSGDTTASANAGSQQALESLSLSPALFVENRGQWSDSSVWYVHNGDGIDVAVADEAVLFGAADGQGQAFQFSASFVGATLVRPTGLERSATVFNYCIGDRAQWRENVPSYEGVVYEGLYEGVDLRIQGLRSHLKYEFHVAPGADHRQIAVRYEGVEGLSIAEDGALQVDLGAGRGVIRDDAPYIYQEIDGRKVEVAGRFILLDDHTYSFELTGNIDPNHALVIDPDLVWSTYLGGGDDDSGSCVEVDGDGNVYVGGYTRSPGWTSGGFDTSYGTGYDAFVTKFNPGGTPLWSTYLGGGGDDDCVEIAVDGAGNVYATGMTRSSNWTSGGFDTTFDGEQDAYVVKFSSGGAHLWSTYVGGSGGDLGSGIALDASGVYVTGSAGNSPGWVSGGFDTSFNGGDDAFVAKLSLDGAHLWSTYLGGSGTDWGSAVAVDSLGDVYVTGTTNSIGWTSGGFFTSYRAGISDGFVVKLSSEGAHLWSTYLGGNDADVSYDIVVYGLICVYVTGSTRSMGWANGGFDSTWNGGLDAFLTMVSLDGGGFANSYLGGSNDDAGQGLAMTADGNVYVTGYSRSSGWTRDGFDSSPSEFHGGSDVFVAKLQGAYTHLWSAYLGGSQDDWGCGIAVNGFDVYVAGGTYSTGWTSGGFDTSHNGSSDAFVARFSGAPDTTTPTPNPSTWETEPYATSQSSIRMVATIASDNSGVEYYFDCLTTGGHDSGWQDSNIYEDTGLRASRTYSYHLRTRDKSTSHNLTLFSELSSATTLPEATPPVIDSVDASPMLVELGTMCTISYTVLDSGGSGVGRIQLFRTSDLDSWPADRISQQFGSGSDGPVSGDFLDAPATTGDWWYRVRVFDVSGNMTESQAVHVVVTDTRPPAPNPSTWRAEPYATGRTSIRMVAAVASDPSGVQYYFHCLTPGGHDSGWQDSNGYEDTGLLPSTTYTYQVKTRDKSTNLNETAYSSPCSAITEDDTAPPDPNPSAWATEPYAVSSTSIRMTATTANDPSGVQYYFHCLTPGGHDSGWQDSATYMDIELSPGTSYAFQVKTRDKSLNRNEGTYSSPASAMTASPVYRFWSPVLGHHFYTISESERDWLVADYSHVWTYEGVAYHAYTNDSQAGVAPVYRFWSSTLGSHFYTINQAERDWLIANYSHVWSSEGIAFYAHPETSRPANGYAVYRFWSASLGGHFYTSSTEERDWLTANYAHVWTLEGAAWYVVDA